MHVVIRAPNQTNSQPTLSYPVTSHTELNWIWYLGRCTAVRVAGGAARGGDAPWPRGAAGPRGPLRARGRGARGRPPRADDPRGSLNRRLPRARGPTPAPGLRARRGRHHGGFRGFGKAQHCVATRIWQECSIAALEAGSSCFNQAPSLTEVLHRGPRGDFGGFCSGF